ncbi:MAG: hypothetical protein NC517_07930 [Firmicutes bacterium]|nr:hypothetical protein [Bacillota bacterium]
MTGVISSVFMILIVVLFVYAVVWGSGPVHKVTAKTQGIVEEVRVETDRKVHTSGAADWGVNRKTYRPYIRYSYEGRSYVGRSEQAFSRAKFFPGDVVTIGVNDVDRESVRILK